MHGNVGEWCLDHHSEGGSHRVFRGGSWSNDAANCRAAYRSRSDPGFRFNYLGFRLALDDRFTSSPPVLASFCCRSVMDAEGVQTDWSHARTKHDRGVVACASG